VCSVRWLKRVVNLICVSVFVSTCVVHVRVFICVWCGPQLKTLIILVLLSKWLHEFIAYPFHASAESDMFVCVCVLDYCV
jgi:hypothetical protein